MSKALLDLKKLLSLTEAMARAAEDQDWEELTRIGNERSLLTTTLPANLSAKLTSSEHVQGREILERCQSLDNQTYAQIGERQHALRILLREPDPVT